MSDKTIFDVHQDGVSLLESIESAFASLRWWNGKRRRRNLAHRVSEIFWNLLTIIRTKDHRIEELERRIAGLVNKGSRGEKTMETSTSESLQEDDGGRYEP